MITITSVNITIVDLECYDRNYNNAIITSPPTTAPTSAKPKFAPAVTSWCSVRARVCPQKKKVCTVLTRAVGVRDVGVRGMAVRGMAVRVVTCAIHLYAVTTYAITIFVVTVCAMTV